jgi:hypothetical protein
MEDGKAETARRVGQGRRVEMLRRFSMFPVEFRRIGLALTGRFVGVSEMNAEDVDAQSQRRNFPRREGGRLVHGLSAGSEITRFAGLSCPFSL